MQIVIDINDQKASEVMEYLRSMAAKITVLSKDAVFLEPVSAEDPDYPLIEEARQRRREGEKLYTLDEVFDNLK